MSAVASCRRCGADLPVEDASRGVCAGCLIRVGLDVDLDEPIAGEPSKADGAAGSPKRVGPYDVIGFLGEGGMGVVYLAEQTGPLLRQVALKLIKPGMDTNQVISRFESERQALALMNHPNIAKVHDAGVTDEGRPFFVMEFVPGIPITTFCRTQRIGLHHRLELFIQVCEAIQHAHQRGIIHRDIKPSNVLVAMGDELPTVKVIDFGIAKATTHQPAERTLFTEDGALIGTPEYMSPEQADSTGQDVDTRTDVYALGVLLYELLAGVVPFDLRRERTTGPDEIRRRIREEEPPKPSTRVTTSGGRAAGADEPSTHARARELRGDLDWITMKALEKDRSRRYDSPGALAADIRRHLKGEAVLAGPPGAAYRVGKFVRRHKVAVGSAALVLTLLVAFAATMTLQANRIAKERDRANLEALAASRVSEFLIDLFEVSDPGEARGSSITAREILDQGTRTMERSLGDEPALQARLMVTMGVVYRNLGLHEQATPLLERSLETLRRLKGDDDPETLRSMRELGALLVAESKLDQAGTLLGEALERSRATLGPDHLDTVAAVAAMGALRYYQGRLDEADAYYREALEGQRRLLGEDHPDTLETINNMSALSYARGHLDEAVEHCREALEGRRRVLGEDHPRTLDSIINMATILMAQDRLEEAEPYYRDALEIGRRVLGPDHHAILVTINNMGALLRKRGDLVEAEKYQREAVESFRRVLGTDHADTLTAMGNLGDLYTSLGRLDEAREILSSTLERVRKTLPHEHVVTGYTLRKLGRCLTAAGRYGEAESALLEAHAVLTATVGAEHVYTKQTVENLVELYEAWGKADLAERWRAGSPPS